MPRLPQVSGRKAVKAFSRTGYQEVRQVGSHIRMRKQGSKPLSIPNHKQLGKGLLKRLLRDSKISPEEFIKLLKK